MFYFDVKVINTKLKHRPMNYNAKTSQAFKF